MRRTATLILLIVTAAVGLVACGSDQESQQEAKQHLCTSLDNFAASVVALQGVGLSSSEDELKTSLDKIDDAWHQVVDDAKDVKAASTGSIESAYEDLKQAVQNRPTDKPLTEVIAGLETKVVAFAQAWKDLASGLDCKTTS
jgi:hypothetical protein